MTSLSVDKRNNNALNVNPPNDVVEHITVRGSDFYFAICAVMGFSALIVAGLMFRKNRQERHFHYMSMALLFTACIAYYTMGADLGYAAIDVEFLRSNPVVRGTSRQVFYARYIDWFVTTPLLLLDILLTAGLPWSTVLATIFFDEVMIVTGLVGALVRTRYKWGYFVAGCIAMFLVFYNLAFVAVPNAKAMGNDVFKLVITLLVLNVTLWSLYPVAWGLCEGGNVISSDSEAVFYGVLDFVAKPIFTAVLLFGHSKIEYARFGLSARSTREGAIIEKEALMRPSEVANGTRPSATYDHVNP